MVKKSSVRLPAVISTYDKYLQYINSVPLLTPKEEYELAIKSWENSDKEASQKLVISNLRFVLKVVNEYRNYGLRLMDLIQEGNIGLMRGVKTFNPYKNVRLITYAVWWIRSYIHTYIQRNWSLVTIGTTQVQRKLFYKLKQEEQELAKHGLLPSVKLLSERLDVSESEVESMQQRLSGRDLSLDTPMGGNDGGKPFLDHVASRDGSAESMISDNEERSIFEKALGDFKKTLKEKDLFILEKRLLADKALTLEEIGVKYKITKERVRQLESKIKKNLKKYMEVNYPDFKIS